MIDEAEAAAERAMIRQAERYVPGETGEEQLRRIRSAVNATYEMRVRCYECGDLLTGSMSPVCSICRPRVLVEAEG